MYARIVCHPPLGRATIVPASKRSVIFTVFVETKSTSSKSIEVSLWHNFHTLYEWESLALGTTIDGPQYISEKDADQKVNRSCFSAELVGRPKHDMPLFFTVRFRAKGDKEWKWVHDQSSVKDGQLYFQPTEPPSPNLWDYFKGISESLSISREASETPGSILWSISGPLEAASGDNSGYTKHCLGQPIRFSKWFALTRLWSPWLAPRHGTNLSRVEKDFVLVSYLQPNGLHVAVLGVSGLDNVTLLEHDGRGFVMINGRNDSQDKATSQVLVSVSNSFEKSTAAVMYHARKLVLQNSSESQPSSVDSPTIETDDVHAQWRQEWIDGLTYCTWNGLGQSLTADRIHQALELLKESDISITNLIIDDNWQSLDHVGEHQNNRGWKAFEADNKAFPEGLRNTVSRIRRTHPNINHVAVWHALMGYWGGISADGQIAKQYKTVEVELEPGFTGERILAVDADDVPRLYHDFYAFLQCAGIDSAKTDAQFFLDQLTLAPQRRSLIRAYQNSWNINQLRAFYSKVISCMSQTPQIIFHSLLPNNKPRIVLRNSDDYFPDKPSSHPWHIFCNAHNSLLTQYLNVTPDWDMFQTSHAWASFHAAARCVSGGPISITDEPGKHDKHLIHQITAKTIQGVTVILRPDIVGKSIDPYNDYHDPVMVKVGNFVGKKGTGAGILGVFNVHAQPLLELIPLTSFPGSEHGTHVIRSFSSGKVTAPLGSMDRFAGVLVELPVQGWDILTACSVRTFTLRRNRERAGSNQISVANLGLIDKMTGAAAVVSTIKRIEGNGKLSINTSLKALGTLGLYISDLKNRSVENDFFALIFGQPVPFHCVKVDTDNSMLSIDLEQAWKESNQKQRWYNEVGIEVYIH